MKFKVLVAGLLAAILSVNIYAVNIIMQEEKKQTKLMQTSIEVQIADSENRAGYLSNGSYMEKMQDCQFKAIYVEEILKEKQANRGK